MTQDTSEYYSMKKLLEHCLRLHKDGRLIEAEGIYRQILAVEPHHADSLHLLGMIAYEYGNLEGAAELIRAAISIHPNGASYHSNLGNVLQAQGKLEEGVAEYRVALAIKANVPEIHINLGNVLQAQGALDDAVVSYQDALQLEPGNAEAFYNLGNTRQAQGNPVNARECYERALESNPNHAKAHHNLGRILSDLGRQDEAFVRFEQALRLEPDNAEIGFNLALAQLMRGDFAAGWVNYEQRWRSMDHDTSMRTYTQPIWTGDPLPAGRLLLWGEQGVGDEIMFAGLVPELVRRGVRCIVDCDRRLQPLFARSFPDVEVVSGYSGQDFAAHLPCGSLPGILGTSRGAFAAYLSADRELQNGFRSRYADGRMLVGLAWHTNARKTGRIRSIDLPCLAPLFALPGIRWVSLQYGDCDSLGNPILFDSSVNQLVDVDGFAAQVAAMDMVITIDNSTAHMAGALGVPVWVLLPSAADWRWLRSGENSSWYPSMRLFRQPECGDWASVVQRVSDELSQIRP
jgi:Flp pilus assembly protein TadD